jgi:phage portal protein BeeE
MENDASAAGNFYATPVDDFGRFGRAATGPTKRLARMRPDWVTIIINSPSDDPWALDAKVVAYEYQPPPSGRGPVQTEPLRLLPEEVVHYSPKPDPMARFRGMSWLTPVIREVMADKAASEHKLQFFRNGAVHSTALKYPAGTSATQLREYKAIYDAEYKGTGNAWKTFHIAGADPIPMSANLKDLDFKQVQGSGETRIAVASGVPAVILGISEGLQGSSLNAGNFGAARRLFVDTTIRDLWAVAAPSLEKLFVSPGADVRLWADDRDIPFCREDASDDADIRAKDALTLKTVTEAGYSPDSAVKYVLTGDLSVLLGQHSGMFSVQLQTPGADTPTDNPPPDPAANGRINGLEIAARR